MNRMRNGGLLFLGFAMVMLAGCSGSSHPTPASSAAPLSADNVNVVFVAAPDLAYHTTGDIDPATANLTSQGLQRSLMMATYLKQQVLGGKNVTGIYTMSPMSHLQTINNYPDMSAIGFIQQFTLLNKIAFNNFTGNNYPINVSYALGGVPAGLPAPTPALSVPGYPAYSPDSTGLDFNNAGGNNDKLVSGIIDKKTPGYYVFSAPWETVNALLTKINDQYGYNLDLPTTYMGTNYVYAISIPSSGKASLVTYNSKLNPPVTYPVLPSPVASAACTNRYQPYFSVTLTEGVNGVTIPPTINTNSTIYIVRHAEAHPDPLYKFDDGNYVAAGQWRALSLANTLRGKIAPDMVYSIDPAAMWYSNGVSNVSYVRPSLTVLPYAIANNLPYNLAAGLSLGSAYNPTDATVAQNTSDFFFTGGKFSNHTVLVAWESGHIKPFINKLLNSYYGGSDMNFLSNDWPAEDYDTVWTVSLDAHGNLTVHNALCEGIDSTGLPASAPMF
jgi:hypothetical protein